MTGDKTLAGVCFGLGGLIRAGLCTIAVLGSVPVAGKAPGVVDPDRHSEQGRSAREWFLPSEFETRTIMNAADLINSASGEFLYLTMYESNVILAVEGGGTLAGAINLDPMIEWGHPFSPTVDVYGTFGGVLAYIDDSRSSICVVSSSGAVTTIALAIEPDLTLVEFDSCGAFGGAMFVLDAEGTLWIVDEERELYRYREGLGFSVSDLAFSESPAFGASRMFLADPGGSRILSIAPEDKIGGATEVWADFSATDIVPVSLAIGEGHAFGEAAMYVADAGRGRILALDEHGQVLNVVATGLSLPLSIEMPTIGQFAGSMVIISDGEVIVVQPIPQTPPVLRNQVVGPISASQEISE